MRDSDWPKVAKIYQQGIETGNATFETKVPSWEEWDKDHLKTCRIVAEENQNVVGWAVLSPDSGRCVFAGVAEVSVYISTDHFGKGIGSELLSRLIRESEQNDLWTIKSGIFPENKVSIHIHEKHGFRIVGIHEKIGKMDDRWRDVVLMERRSKIVGPNS